MLKFYPVIHNIKVLNAVYKQEFPMGKGRITTYGKCLSDWKRWINPDDEIVIDFDQPYHLTLRLCFNQPYKTECPTPAIRRRCYEFGYKFYEFKAVMVEWSWDQVNPNGGMVYYKNGEGSWFFSTIPPHADQIERITKAAYELFSNYQIHYQAI